MKYRVALSIRLAAAGIMAAAITLPNAAAAQNRALSLPAQPLQDALEKIAAWSGKPVNVDPDAVKGLTSRPVVDARSADDAVRQATSGLPIVRERDADGNPTVANDILIVARRDEAETSVLVRGATQTSRLGQSLRDQPRNTQVISSKLLEQQQVQTLSEALANAGGVVVNSTTIQNGVSYSIRGFSTNGSVNGLPSASNSSFAAGATQPIANIERLEVLKGPDAILLGGDSMGGTVNIVTKKPSAEERLYVSAETGSFGLVRGSIDANRAITADDRVSARIIATAASADRNFGGYRGNEDYLFAPSLRFKNGVTDAVLSATLGTQIFGTAPYTIYNPTTKRPFDVAFDRPLIGGENQFIRVGTTQFTADLTQKLTDWATIVVRGQHQDSSLALSQYSPYVLLAPNGLALVSSLGVRQTSNNDVVDGFIRLSAKTGAISHKVVAGYTYVDGEVRADSAGDGSFAPYNFLTGTPPLGALATRYTFSNGTTSKLNGYYGQYLLEVGPIHLLAGIRNNQRRLVSVIPNRPNQTFRTNVTTPNFGAVVDVTDSLSVFGTLAYGFQPTLIPDRLGNRLPDIKSRNAETGIKWDLFDKAMLINASWFSIRESNRLLPDPVNTRFQVAVPGLLGRGIDLNVSGEPVRGLSLVASYVRAKYRYITPSARLGNIVNAQPRETYSFYGSYRRKVANDVSAGLGGGVSGRSSSAIDRFGVYRVPASFQADLNGFLTIGRLDLNLGVRNLTDKQNFAPTISEGFVPLGEPRTWRLTAGYRFK